MHFRRGAGVVSACLELYDVVNIGVRSGQACFALGDFPEHVVDLSPLRG